MASIHEQIAELSPEQRKLLELLLEQEEQRAPAPSSGIPRRPDSPIAPVSFAQQRMWLLDQLEPGNPLYTLPTAMRVSGSFDLLALHHSLTALIRRHDSLRTTFVLRQAEPLQQIAPPRPLPLWLLDLQSLPTRAREAALRRLLAAAAEQTFDLARGPLLHIALLRLAPTEHVLLVSMHHIIADGWSIRVFLRELLALYAARVSGEPAQLPELPLQYADFAHWQREWLQGEGDHAGSPLQTQLDYWREQLVGVPVLHLSTDYPRPARHSYRSAHQPFNLGPGLTSALQDLSQSAGVTLFMTLLAGFSALLARLSGQQDFCVGTVVANRTQPDLERVIGFFVNNLALRMDLRGEPRVRELLERVRVVTLGAYDHQDVPFEHVLAAIQPERAGSHSPLFQVMCVLQNYPRPQVELAGLRLTPLRTEARRSGFDLTLWMWEERKQLIGELEYNPKLFGAATIRRMGTYLRTLLEGMVAEPEQRLARLRLMPEAERREVLEEWNATTVAYPREQCIHTLFEAQAERSPDAVAVVFGETTNDRRPTTDDIQDKETSRQGDKEILGGRTDNGSPFSVQPPRGYPAFSVQHLTYQALNRRANQLAYHLGMLGVRPGVQVGICLERSVELIIGLLGILKAGGAYVPLDPAYPHERVAFMLEDSGAAVVLTMDNRSETRRAGDKETDDLPLSMSPPLLVSRTLIDLRRDWPTIARQSETSPDPARNATAADLLYVIYTSGSTGRPKGAGVYHRGFVNLLHWFVTEFEIAFHDRVLLITSLSFDLTQKNIFAPLITGGSLYLLGSEYYDIGVILRLISDNAITLLNCTPSAFYPLVDQFDQRIAAKLASLRYVFLGGEPIAVSRMKNWITSHDCKTTVVNTYGPTECTDICAFYRLRHPERFLETSVPIGKPIFNIQLYILDKDLQLLPVGAVGELCVAGDGVGCGYLNDSDLTALKFVPDPFGRARGARLYRTGDLVRYLSDGNIEFLGRVDEQVKVRGFRIELGEIETVLNQHPAVEECVVVVRGDGLSEKRLVAYVVPTREQGTGDRGQENVELATASLSPVTYHLSPTELRAYLRERLPEYMVPSAFVLLDALPLTPSGKVDRRALPTPDTARPALDNAFVPPRTPVEVALAQIWTELLRVARVGIHDNFFALGGHSLLATQIIARVRESLQVELPLRSLFEVPTVAGLAGRIEAARRDAAELLPPLLPTPRDHPLPLSFAQQRLWFLDQLDPDGATYTIPAAVRLAGPLDMTALLRSLNAIVQRHEALRTTFAILDEQPVQVIAPVLRVPVPLVDLQALPASRREAEALRLATDLIMRPFDMARGPLLRAILVRREATEHIALLTMHHIVSDGWSIGVFIAELAALYAAFAQGHRASLPALPIQYADYAMWQRAWLQGAGGHAPLPLQAVGDHVGSPLQAQLAYWRRHLAGLPLVQLPTDFPRPPRASLHGAQVVFALPQELSDALEALSQGEGVTLFMTGLAAWNTLLARYTAQDDIVVGTPIAGRRHKATEHLIGFFVNMLALRSRLAGDPTFLELLRRTREVALGAYAHQDVPFEEVVEALQPARDLSRHPIFQVMFSLQNEQPPTLNLPDLTLTPLPIEYAAVKFDLSLVLIEAPTGLAGVLRYRTDLFEPATISRMARHVQALLRGIVADPGRRLADLPLLTDAERQQLLVEWSAIGDRGQGTGVGSDLSDSWLLTSAFEAQAARTPDAIAIVFDATTTDHRPTTNDTQDKETRRQGDKEIQGRSTDKGSLFSLQPPASSLQHLTYVELNRRANQFAHHLRALGVGPEVRVGLCLDRSLELVIGLLGVLKAGGACLALDPSYPAERIAFMLEDSGAAVVVTLGRGSETRRQGDKERDDLLVSLSPGLLVSRQVVDLSTDWPDIARQPASNLESGVAPDQLAYVIYSSGPTARPNGVLVEHRSLAAALDASLDLFRPNDVMPWMASVSFDMALFELLAPLLAGGTVVVLDQQQLSDLDGLRATLERCTVFHAVPGLMRQIVQAIRSGEHDRPAPARPRLICVAGDHAPADLLTDLRALFPAAAINLLYGAAEAAIIGARYVVPHDVPLHGQPIGRPLPHVHIRLCDRRGRPVPIGAVGEVYLGGVGVARGYLNRPDLTAERFVPDPFENCRLQIADCRLSQSAICNLQSAIGTRLYKTGDLARYRADGTLEYLGRRDQVRSSRLEIGEVEAVLRQHPALQECVVEPQADGSGDQRLVAYLVPQPEQAPSITELRQFLQARLPESMLPSAFVFLGVLPLTANGEIDRRGLPAPGQERPAPDQTFLAPRTRLEQLLAALWRDLLGLEAVGVHDSFFDLGGNSIQAALFANKLQAMLGEVVYVVAVFDAPTIAELAVYLAEQYPAAVGRLLGIDGRSDGVGAQNRVTPAHADQIGEAQIAEFRRAITPLPPYPARAIDSPNPPAIFVLSPPRSGSTLLRVMLTGHSRLFAPPELELLSFNTLAERKAAFTGRNRFWLEGALRAIMAIKGCDASAAERLMEACEQQDMSVQQFYHQLQTWLGERTLVDKTPAYALDPAILARMERDFDQAKYIHLLRHPYGMIRSFEEAKLGQVFFRHRHSFTTRELAELIWLISQQNILAFLQQIPAERQHAVRFEDLVTHPRRTLEGICAFLGLEFQPTMLDPYQAPQQRMTDGIHAMSKMVGDVKFHTHRGIDATVSERWKQQPTSDRLGAITWQVAEALGYPHEPHETAAPASASADAPPRRLAARSLLVALQRHGARHPFVCVHPAGGEVLCYYDLAQQLGADQPVYGMRAIGLDGEAEPAADIRMIAKQYVDVLRSEQPEGPYLLGGWSMGGVVAFEMAQQLRGHGQSVALLALFDPPPPLSRARRLEEDDLAFLAGFAQHLGLIVDGSAPMIEHIRQLDQDARLRHLLEQAQQAKLLPPDIQLPDIRRRLDLFRLHGHALRTYRPERYAGRIMLFQAVERSPSERQHPAQDWSTLAAGGVEMYTVPGNHYAILRPPHVRVLAERLRAMLDELAVAHARAPVKNSIFLIHEGHEGHEDAVL